MSSSAADTETPGAESTPKTSYDMVADYITGHGIGDADYARDDLARLGAVYNNGALRAVHVHMNHRKSDALEFAEGQAIVFSPDAPVNHEFMRPDLNGQFMASLVTSTINPSDTLSDEYFRGRLQALAAAVPAEHELAARELVIDARDGRDVRPWEAVLGRGSLVGVYRTETAPNVYAFFLIARIDETPIGYDAYRHAERCADAKMTLYDYVDNCRTRQLIRLARRNAERVLVKVATALGVRIACIRDSSASHPKLTTQKPLIAVPKVHCQFNVTCPAIYEGENAIVHYDSCIDAYGAKNGLLFAHNPLVGITLVQGSRRDAKQFSNAAANSFPMRAGRGRDAVAARIGDGNGRVSFDRAYAATHPELAPTAARSLTRDDLALLEALSGEENGSPSIAEQRLTLTPVIVHLSPPRGS